MDIREINQPAQLENVGPDILGFDLEMANSFVQEHPVICMVGLAHYDPERQACVGHIASITEREEEQELVHWFLDYLGTFSKSHPKPTLLTFSGSDNDLPWMNERITRYGIPPERSDILSTMRHMDLRMEFQRRTQSNRISLKRLEEVFGIQRENEVSSKKVSYLLTDLVRKRKNGGIPASIFQYLTEDVHHLLLILDQWEHKSLRNHYLTEYEYFNQTLSLQRLSRRLAGNAKAAPDGKTRALLAEFAQRVHVLLEDSARRATLEGFQIPPLPPISIRGQDLERLQKKYQALSEIEVTSPTYGYRLSRQLDKPKGSLALVRRRGKVLMIRRADSLARLPGYWGLPGGVLEQGESPCEGAMRELREELHLEGRPVQILGTRTTQSGEYELFWVELEVADFDPLAPHTSEVAEVRWVGPEELPRLEPLVPGAAEGFRDFLGADWGRHPRRH
ncbi:MAG: NUDIX domain-containing protein [Deltaproteobacteria bacterium]|nr:NUDIX domain-containing protein [Deltaproteobacteria bacterium]